MACPNFFVIGAQKCGTDALYDALKQHAEIFMSPEKEPAFFSMDGRLPAFRMPSPGYRGRLKPDWDQYLALFDGARDQVAIGEASAIYLSAYQPERTAMRLKERIPEARLIALVRQPAERAHAAFHFYHARNIELFDRLPAALAAEMAGQRDDDCPDVWHWRNGFYHANLKPFFEIFPAERIKVFLQEEWRQEPQRVLSEIFAFLGVADDPTIDVRRLNVTKRYYSRTLAEILRGRAHRWLHSIAPRPLIQQLDRLNSRAVPPMDPALRAELTQSYRADILALEALIGKDLSHWLVQDKPA